MLPPAAEARDLYEDLRPGSELLVVAFAGLAEEMGIPAFEFMKLLSTLEVQCILVRDSRRIWYQRGVSGAGQSVDAVADHLAERIAALSPRRVTFIGSSAGGYAAILFSSIVPAHKVVAFAPQTFIDPDQRAAHGDTRWAPATAALREAGGPEMRYADLLPLLERLPGDRPSIDVHYSNQSDLDILHAVRLAAVPGVELIPHPSPGHNVPAYLKRREHLPVLIADSLELPPAGA
ncbi:MAG TPA: hypothetical protein VN758_14540 [Solirubrobacterales bacterium]|nr:hypothetical protein [Solirubrobacterales bacterium]